MLIAKKLSITLIGWVISIAATAYFVHDYTVALADQEQLEAVNKAVKQERLKQAGVDKLERELYADLQIVNTRLNSQLDELRKRPSRLPSTTSVQCAGSTGAELSGPDARFLGWYAADTEDFRLRLIACQKYIRSLQK